MYKVRVKTISEIEIFAIGIVLLLIVPRVKIPKQESGKKKRIKLANFPTTYRV